MEQETTRLCPHCGHEAKTKDHRCPQCDWTLHWDKRDQRVYEVNYLQSTLTKTWWTLCFIIAVAGQICMFLANDMFDGLVPFRPTLCAGHLMRACGETALLYGLWYGLRFEYKRLAWLIAAVAALFIAYHLAIIAYCFHDSLPLPDNAKALLPDAGFYLLVASEAAAALLGYMLFDNYNGRLSTTGFVMAAAMLLHLLLNVLLHLSGVNIAADLAVGAANIAYFCLLKNRFLTHEEYVRKVRGKKA